MKQLIQIKLMLITAFTVLAACNRQNDEPQISPLDDNSLPSAAIVNVVAKNKNGNHLRFSMDIAVFRDSRNMEDRLKEKDFQIDSVLTGSRNYSFTREAFQFRNGQNRAGYSALLLMDQSGSIGGTDRNNFRIDAAKAFCANLGVNDKIVLWSFSGSNYIEYGNGYTTDTTAVIAQIEELRDKHGGNTPLYKSQLAAIEYSFTQAPGSNKAVMTFTDGQNTGSGVKPEEVISSAKAKNIHLYNVGLGDAETDLLCRQAVQTGGAFMYAKDARQLISMFGNLGKLLDHTAAVYHTEWLINGNREFKTGTLVHSLNIILPDGQKVTVPFTLDY